MLDSRLQRIRERLPIYLTDLTDNPRWIVMFIFGRIVALRRALRALRALRNPTAGTASGTVFGSISIADTVTSLERDGLFAGIRLPRHVVDDLREFAQQTSCYGNVSKKISFFPSEHKEAESKFATPILVGHYLEKIEDCPRVREIQEDPLLREIASRYLKRKPNILSSRMWWSFPVERFDDGLARLASQSLHFDMNDWSSVKFFFYLTDVDADSGPHVYVQRSHRRKRLRDQFTVFAGKRISEVIDFYGASNFVTICGPAGFGFAEDPFGLHMGTVVQKGPRLVLEIEYGLSNTTRRQYYGSLVETDAA
jgi:hypothetical protein